MYKIKLNIPDTADVKTANYLREMNIQLNMAFSDIYRKIAELQKEKDGKE